MTRKLTDIIILIIVLMIAYIGIILQSHVIGNRIIFQHPKSSYIDSQKIIKLKTKDGTRISAVYLKNPDAKFTILYSHGNAADLGLVYPILQEFYNHGFSIIAYDYHGYGTSGGKPSENNTYEDIEAVYNYLIKIAKVNPKNIIAYGTSVGAAVTLYLAEKNEIAGIILQSPFLSAYRVLTVLPIIPFDKYNNLERIKKIKVPILIIHGMADDTIPFWHARQLYELSKGKKFFLWVKNANHNDIMTVAGEQFWLAIKNFISILT